MVGNFEKHSRGILRHHVHQVAHVPPPKNVLSTRIPWGVRIAMQGAHPHKLSPAVTNATYFNLLRRRRVLSGPVSLRCSIVLPG